MMPQRLIIMVGLPRSGKSTLARKFSEQFLAPIVCLDNLRLAVHGQRVFPQAETFILYLAQTMVRSLFLSGHDTVILDATSVQRRHRDLWREYPLAFVRVDTPADVCKERAILTGQPDLLPVIDKMAAEFEPLDPSEGELLHVESFHPSGVGDDHAPEPGSPTVR